MAGKGGEEEDDSFGENSAKRTPSNPLQPPMENANGFDFERVVEKGFDLSEGIFRLDDLFLFRVIFDEFVSLD